MEFSTLRTRPQAKDLTEMQCVDAIVEEPEGGAQANHEAAAQLLDRALGKTVQYRLLDRKY